MRKLVSIVIPCYNHEKFLDSCIQSLVDQSYENIELLICDDCSPDSSFEKLLAWKPRLEDRFSRVEIYKNEVNQGVCKTLNGLVERARGDYIKTLATDDMLLKDAISDYVAFAERCAFDIAFSNVYIINEREQYPVQTRTDRKTAYSSVPPHGSGLTGRLIAENFVQGASLFIRRETFEKYGIFAEQYFYEDWEFLLRVSTTGIIEYMDKIPAYYRVMDGSLSHYDTSSDEGRRKFRRYYGDTRKIFEKYKDHATKAEQNVLFNQIIRTAIVLEDSELVGEIVAYMRTQGMQIYWDNRLRICAQKIGAYNMLRSVKHWIKGAK